MHERSSFDYAVIRVVPRVDREEFINAGVVLFCRERRFLAARVALDRERLAVLAPELDAADVQRHLDLLPLIAAGGRNSGPIGALPQADRFHWLVSPRSTIIQPSVVHTGLCDNPQAALDGLMARVVQRASLPDAPHRITG